MLSPTINRAKDLLAQALNEILRIDGYAGSTRSIAIAKLTEDPAWLASVRSRVAMLAAAGGNWIIAKPDIWGPVLNQFSTYNSSLAAVASMQKDRQLVTAADWVQVLQAVLLPGLHAAADATDAAAAALQTQLSSFADVEPLLTESINEGWAALASEEQQMVRIATQLAHLQDLVSSLEDAVTSSSISDGKGVVSTVVSIVYDVTIDGAEGVPFLSLATSAITVGKFFADAVQGSEQIQATLQSIAELQLEATEAAQAASATKMVLQLLDDLQSSFKTIGDVIPQLSTMWRDQKDGVQQAIDALTAGANPNSYFDLLTLPVAASNWQIIAAFAASLPTIKTAIGTPVVLRPQQTHTRST